MMMSDGDGGGGSKQISLMEKIPGEAQAIGTADADSLVDNPDVKTPVNSILSTLSQTRFGTNVPEDYDEIIKSINKELNLSTDKMNSVTLFGKYDQETTGSDVEDYVGMIFDTDWTENEFVESLKSDWEEIVENTYKDVTIYIGTEQSEKATLAVLPDDTYALGPKKVALDVIDAVKGDIDSLAGSSLESEYKKLGDKQLKGSMEFPSSELPDPQPGIPIDFEALKDMKYLSGSFNIDDPNIDAEFRLKGPKESTATDLENSINSFIDLLENSEIGQIEPIADELDKVEVGADGETVTISYESTADDISALIKKLDEMQMSQ